MAKSNIPVKSPEEYEAAFHRLGLPATFELATGVVVPDVNQFVDKSIHILKTGKSERIAAPIRWRLDKLLAFIENPA